MGLYNFKPQFVPFILNGTKAHTIRAIRKDGLVDEPGDTMFLYTGLRQRGPIIQKLPSGEVVRQKMSRLLGKPKCVKREDVRFALIGGAVFVRIAGQDLDPGELEAFAKRDGFPGGFPEMVGFWKKRLQKDPVWTGYLYHWEARGFRK